VAKKERIVCALDIGTSKVCMMLARQQPGGGLTILNTGYAASSGLRKGVVVDIEAATAAIRTAAEEAELKSGVSGDWVTLGLCGEHIQGRNCHGAVQINGARHEVSKEHVAQVIHAAQSLPVAPQREIIHILPQEFFLDNRGDIRNPVGLNGSRLDVNVHIVTCETSLMQDVIGAVNRAQMRVKKVYLQQLASAEAVLTRDERELGSAVVDVGAGTTDIAVYVRNAVWHTSVLPVGGNHFTRDLAVGLRTPTDDAESIKKQFGSVLVDTIAEDETVEVRGMGNNEPRVVPRKVACEILRDRAAELLELIKQQIADNNKYGQLLAGVVLTGGGSMLTGMVELASEMLEVPVRRGLPGGIAGLAGDLSHPVYSTAVGLALLGAQEEADTNRHGGKSGPSPRLLSKFLSWVGNQD
jgi:cell division protein FtsA